MKKIIMTILALASAVCVMAQSSKPIPIGVYVSDDNSIVPSMAQATLNDKLRQIVTRNGMGADNNAQFFITCTVNLTDKDVISGAPARIVQNADLSFYIADAATERIYETYSMSVRGVGENETKAFVAAFKSVKPTAPEFSKFVASGSKKIVAYYESQIDNLIKQSAALAKSGEYESALYVLSVVPDVCAGYDKVNDAAMDVYQKMIDAESIKLLQKAKAVWAAGRSYDAAQEAGSYLAEVSPYSSCYDEVEALVAEIKEFVVAERQYDREQAEEEIDWLRKIAERELDVSERQIDAWRDVGVAYGENQQRQYYRVWW